MRFDFTQHLPKFNYVQVLEIVAMFIRHNEYNWTADCIPGDPSAMHAFVELSRSLFLLYFGFEIAIYNAEFVHLFTFQIVSLLH